MKRAHLVLVAGAIGLAGMVGNASAQDIGFSISVGSPAHYGHQPVYVAQPAVLYAPPPVAYHRHTPAYYGNTVVSYQPPHQHRFAHQHHGFHPGWQGHHGR